MPQIQLNSQSLAGWPGAGRNDLPPYDQFADLVDGDTSNISVAPLGAKTGKVPHSSMPDVRNLTYQYVDTGFSAIHQANVLWSDSASWCTIVTLWSMGRAGLAHVVPGDLAASDTTALLNLFGAAAPDEIHLVTMPAFLDYQTGFVTVRNTIAAHYGAAYANIRTHLISGYAGHDWEQKHQLAVDPKSGAYPVFN